MRRKLRMLTVLLLILVLVAGCGDSGDSSGKKSSRSKKNKAEQAEDLDEDDEDEDEEDEDDEDDKDVEEPEKPEEKPVADEREEALCGNWIFVRADSNYYTNGVWNGDSYQYMAEDDPDYVRELSIYRDGDGIYADMDNYGYESRYVLCHLPVFLEEGALYGDCANQDWKAEVRHPDPNKSDVNYELTLSAENELVIYEMDETPDEETGDIWGYENVSIYLREGSAEAEKASDYRYANFVQVSNVDELIAAIASDTKITLAPGTYNLSEVKNPKDTDNVKFTVWGEPYTGSDRNYDVELHDLNNFCLEAEKGAQVEICTNNELVPVLGVHGCENTFLNGITMGHHVEPGTCGGSVLYVFDSYGVRVNDCDLYGCGTYGLEGYGASNVTLNRTKIHDCTYGIMDLNDCGAITVQDCTMSDNSDLSLISMTGTSGLRFLDCVFSGNTVNKQYETAEFVRCDEESYAIYFENCKFTDNTYKTFTSGENVTTEGCVFDDNKNS